MIRFRKNLIAVFIGLWPMVVMGQEADFEIRNFCERTTDLSAISSNYKDLNGRPAALIRFTVRDPQFEFSANLGIIKTERKTGEVYLYIPQDTRRLTIRHPRLGVLKDYEIPFKIMSKVTYAADIVITEKERMPEQVRQQQTEIYEDRTSGYSDYYYQPQLTRTVKTYSFSDAEFHVYVGLGFNAVSLMGPSVYLGASYGMFSLEGGFVYGLDKVENVSFMLQGSSFISEAYDYSCSKAWARLGLNFDMDQFCISPQAGVTFNMISGKSVLNGTPKTEYFKESYPMSAFAAIRFSYQVVDHLHIHLTPQYDFNIGGDQIFEVIKQGDSKIKAWGEGFGINAGIIYEF